MLIGYSMPAVSAIALSGGAGYAWLTSDNGSACYDGKPARRARLRWRNDAVPAIGHTLSITLDIASTPLRVVAALGLKNVPAGAKVEVYGKRAADAGTTYNFGGSNTGTVVKLADGSFAAWFVLPATATAVEKIEFRIFNDVAGVTWATAATTVDVGELVAMPAVDIKIDAGWSQPFVDPTQTSSTRGSQVTAVPLTAYRELAGTFSLSAETTVRYAALANSMDWDRLAIALSGARRCVAIPRWETVGGNGVVSSSKLNAHAMYGVATEIGDSAHVRGPWWQKAMKFREIPPG